MKCDFCSDPNPAWAYPAQDFQLKNAPIVGSEGGWAACDECAALIERRDRGALIDRCVAKMPYIGIPVEFLRPVAKEIHDQFFECRAGHVERVRI